MRARREKKMVVQTHAASDTPVCAIQIQLSFLSFCENAVNKNYQRQIKR